MLAPRHACNWFGLVFAAMLLLAGSAAVAAPPSAGDGLGPVLSLDPSRKWTAAGPYLAVFKDPSRKLTLADIRSERYARLFRVTGRKRNNMGIGGAALWVRFRLKNGAQARELKRYVVEFHRPNVAEVSFFYPDQSGRYQEVRGGVTMPYHVRPLLHHVFAYNVNVSPEGPRTYYLRLRSAFNVTLPIFIWPQEYFLWKARREMLYLGLYFGIVLVMMIYNLVLFFYIRQPSYLHYSAYILCYGLFQFTANGLGFEFLWPRFPALNTFIFTVLMSAALITGMQFARDFLDTRGKLPIVDRLLLGAMGLSVLLPVFHFVQRNDPGYMVLVANNVVPLSSVLLISLAAVLRWRMGYRPALYFMIAWAVLIAGAVANILRNLGVAPDNLFSEYGLQFGSALEMILLSFALGFRFNEMRDRKEQAEREAVETRLRMLDSFSRFVPRQFLNYLERGDITEVQAGDSVRKEMTVLFTDIRDFTAHSEGLDSSDVFRMLNVYLEEMDPLIHDQGGFIDKFIGDAIMALFPSPESALKSALAMRAALPGVNARLTARGLPAIDIGIGVNTGDMILGTVGAKTRLDTTVIGDSVNVASRLEALTKSFGSPVIVSESVQSRVSAHDFDLRLLEEVQVKGRTDAIVLYALHSRAE